MIPDSCPERYLGEEPACSERRGVWNWSPCGCKPAPLRQVDGATLASPRLASWGYGPVPTKGVAAAGGAPEVSGDGKQVGQWVADGVSGDNILRNALENKPYMSQSCQHTRHNCTGLLFSRQSQINYLREGATNWNQEFRNWNRLILDEVQTGRTFVWLRKAKFYRKRKHTTMLIKILWNPANE